MAFQLQDRELLTRMFEMCAAWETLECSWEIIQASFEEIHPAMEIIQWLHRTSHYLKKVLKATTLDILACSSFKKTAWFRQQASEGGQLSAAAPTVDGWLLYPLCCSCGWTSYTDLFPTRAPGAGLPCAGDGQGAAVALSWVGVNSRIRCRLGSGGFCRGITLPCFCAPPCFRSIWA